MDKLVREVLPAEHQGSDVRYRGVLAPRGAPRARNEAVAAMLAKAREIDLSAEREQVRGVVDRVKRLFGRSY